MIKTLFVLLFTSHILAQVPHSPGFPKWLKSTSGNPEQTSGITFLKNEGNEQQFLLVDDIGKISRLVIREDTIFTFYPVNFAPGAEQFLEVFPKRDFEEITYDAQTGSVYLSIEGNGPEYKSLVGIFELGFARGSIYSDTVVSIQRLSINPEALIKAYTANNIGYEGMAVDNTMLYLGLEGFQNGDMFADSTFIYIIDKKTRELQYTIPTHDLGIHTICGMYAMGERELLIVDRNSRKIHYLVFDENFSVARHVVKSVTPAIPGFGNLEYNMALESISGDGRGNVYLIDDPWKSHYKPEAQVFNKLDLETQKNFGKFIPIIYKFDLSTFTKE